MNQTTPDQPAPDAAPPDSLSGEEVAYGAQAVIEAIRADLEGVDAITITGLQGDKVQVTVALPGQEPRAIELSEDAVAAVMGGP